jgi:ABC-type multidrug transport system ATPase subunit
MVDIVQIGLSGIGKRFNRWVFRDIDLELHSGVRYGVIGHNGVGKSTLLRIISGYMSPTEGRVTYLQDKNLLDPQRAALTVGYVAPYVSLISELTVREMLNFHLRFKPVFEAVSDIDTFLSRIHLQTHADVFVGDLSSGLMQRLKLGIMVLSRTMVLLLDEPTSYLDLAGKQWYYELVDEFATGRLIIVASNDPEDLVACEEMIDMVRYVPVRRASQPL